VVLIPKSKREKLTRTHDDVSPSNYFKRTIIMTNAVQASCTERDILSFNLELFYLEELTCHQLSGVRNISQPAQRG
jgi:hypothetical protein